jgi:pimeloyl-ACP methyl ester carboxylesterase
MKINYRKILIAPVKILFLAITLLIIALYVFQVLAIFREEHNAHAIIPIAGKYIFLDNEKIYVQSYGKDGDQPILLVHGTAAWSGLWKETATFISQNGYKVYALDLPPFGFSDRPVDAKYGRLDQAQRIIRLLKVLRLKKTIIVGHSFGSGAAVESVMQNKEMFSGLVLIDAALNLMAKGKNTELPLLLQNLYIRDLIISSTVTNPLATKALLKTLLHKKDINLDKYVDILQKPMSIKGSTQAVSQWVPFLLLDENEALSAHRERYSALSLPVKLIWGNKDSITPLEQAKDLLTLVPHASLSILKDVGHIPQIEDPSSFQKALLVNLNSMRTN